MRCFFYSLPLFIQWIIGLTFEKGEREISFARSGMVAGIFYIISVGAIFFLQKIFIFLFSGQEYYISLGAASLHATVTASYLLYSLVVGMGGLLKLFSPPVFILRLGTRLEKLFSIH